VQNKLKIQAKAEDFTETLPNSFVASYAQPKVLVKIRHRGPENRTTNNDLPGHYFSAYLAMPRVVV